MNNGQTIQPLLLPANREREREKRFSHLELQYAPELPLSNSPCVRPFHIPRLAQFRLSSAPFSRLLARLPLAHAASDQRPALLTCRRAAHSAVTGKWQLMSSGYIGMNFHFGIIANNAPQYMQCWKGKHLASNRKAIQNETVIY